MDQVNVNRNVQDSRLPLIPRTLSLDAISKRKEVKLQDKNSAVTEVIVVLQKHVPHAAVWKWPKFSTRRRVDTKYLLRSVQRSPYMGTFFLSVESQVIISLSCKFQMFNL